MLAQNSHRVVRGQKSVTLTDYLPDGQVVERVIALDPKRSLKEEVEHRFHQYRRLERGAALAAERLAELDAEEAAVRAELERVRAVSADDVNSQLAANVTHASSTAAAVRKAKAAREGRPYREYLGHAGRRIWVGRGSKHNDALTFQVAKPFHLWLHALGVPGAHVVVPLERNETISAELLIDAAHLALHHSDFKGEPRGEVSSVPVKFVRKGAAPGAVTYTREKNIMVRVEPERLKRLLANEVE